MKLFQSIFGGDEARGHYPESLVRAAIERAVDGTDARLRLVPGYQKRLRQSVVHAIDHVVALVDAIPAPLVADRRQHSAEPRLDAVFASAGAMLDMFGRDTELTAFLTTPEGRGVERVTALLLAERMERNILGMDLVGDRVRRDVQQVTVSFAGHRLLDPRESEGETRRQLKRRAFDHLLTLALTRIAEAREEREDLLHQRDLLRRKCEALECGGWGFGAPEGTPPDAAAVSAELDAISAQLDSLGADGGVLHAHLGIVAESLGEAERQLWAEDIVLSLDSMNIQRDAADPSARRIALQELHNAHGRRMVMLPISLTPRDLPQREDFVTAAQRYL
jgi:hypothetical protein